MKAAKRNFNLVSEVQKCSRYIIEKKERENTWGRSTYSPEVGGALPLHDKSGVANFLEQLESSRKKLDDVVKSLTRISANFEFGFMAAFEGVASPINTTLNHAENALAEVTCLMQTVRVEHPAKTRNLALEKSAVRLAFAMKGSISRRIVRKVAKDIMDGAGLNSEKVDDSTITKWLNEFESEDAESSLWLSQTVKHGDQM